MKLTKLNKGLLVLLLCMASSSTWAKTYLDCFKNASKHYGVPYELLTAISFTESSFRATAANKRNRNGTADYGLMQINTLWRKAAGRYGFSWHAIKTQPCVNVKFGALILRNNYRRLGSWPQAVGAYNAGFSTSQKAKARRAAYYRKVVRNKKNARRYISRLKKRTTAKNTFPGSSKKASTRVAKASNKSSQSAKKKAVKRKSKKATPVIIDPTPQPLDMSVKYY